MAAVGVNEVRDCSQRTSAEYEFYLSEGSGDEFFQVLDQNGAIVRQGEVVGVNRGDRVRVSFNAFFQNSREYAQYGKRYALESILLVDADGLLVLSNGDKHPADGFIDLYQRNGNCLKFSHSPEEGEITTVGIEEFGFGPVKWSFNVEACHVITKLSALRGCSMPEAEAELREWLADRTGEFLYTTISELLCRAVNGDGAEGPSEIVATLQQRALTPRESNNDD
jgi:hypothetical protein